MSKLVSRTAALLEFTSFFFFFLLLPIIQMIGIPKVDQLEWKLILIFVMALFWLADLPFPYFLLITILDLLIINAHHSSITLGCKHLKSKKNVGSLHILSQ